nr:MAG TPA: cellulose biosynthesis protein [Caudoviricetes sp.]
MTKSIVWWFGRMNGMSRESIEDIVLILLSSFLIGVMVVAGYLLVTGIPAFARFLFTVWYVLTV